MQGLSASIVPLTRFPSKTDLLRYRVPVSIPQGAYTHEGSIPSGTLPSPRKGLDLSAWGCRYPIQVENRFFRSTMIVCGMKPHAHSDHDRD